VILIDPDSTLADIVTAHPSAARLFERHGLDYCCGGSRTLSEACVEGGLDRAGVVAELAEQATGDASVPLTALSLIQLVDHIEATYHVPLWRELERLDSLLEKVVRVHGPRHAELRSVHDTFRRLRADLEPHLRDEEHTIFPAIRRLDLAPSRDAAPLGLIEAIDGLAREHDVAGALLSELRMVTSGYRVPDDGCAAYRACYAGLADLEADLHLHVHTENNVLFPAADRAARRLALATP
jgi:regulator of cell morphogenesis and NO signaling